MSRTAARMASRSVLSLVVSTATLPFSCKGSGCRAAGRRGPSSRNRGHQVAHDGRATPVGRLARLVGTQVRRIATILHLGGCALTRLDTVVPLDEIEAQV